MSANSTKLPLHVECFIEERDVSGEMQRAQMEEICADTFTRVERTLRAILHNASKCATEMFNRQWHNPQTFSDNLRL